MERNIQTWVWWLQWRGHYEALVGGRSHWPLITRYQEINAAILPPDGNEGCGMKANPVLGISPSSREETITISHASCCPSLWKGPGLRQSGNACVCACVHFFTHVWAHTHAHISPHLMRRVESLGLIFFLLHQQTHLHEISKCFSIYRKQTT